MNDSKGCDFVAYPARVVQQGCVQRAQAELLALLPQWLRLALLPLRQCRQVLLRVRLPLLLLRLCGSLRRRLLRLLLLLLLLLLQLLHAWLRLLARSLPKQHIVIAGVTRAARLCARGV